MLRTTLRSLLSRKLRLVLSGLAVVLGVMAVSGALIVSSTLTNSFDELFATTTEGIDLQVSGRTNVTNTEGAGGDPVAEPVAASVVDQVKKVPGVADAYGDVAGDGARVVGPDGKVIVNQGPPTLGVAWHDDGLVELRSGREPRADDEVAMNASLVERGGFQVGQRVEVLTLEPKQTFTLVGVFGYTGGRDTLGGETTVAFTERAAQELILGAPGRYSDVVITAEPGTDLAALRTAVQAAVGGDHVVRTAEEVAAAQASDVSGFVGVLRNVLLGFAAVALFVGIFLILNTFSILVAQRTGELALLRSLGANRPQVIGSVLLEAVIIGLVASTLGLGAGMGVALALKEAMQSFSNATLPGALLVVPASAVIASYAVGVLVTVVAAVLPALRASRVAPVEAMREARTTTRPSRALTVVGGVLTVGGAAAVGLGLYAVEGDAGLWTLLAGVMAAFIGVAMLTPAICGPMVNVLGRAFSFSTAGKLGRLNSARNPRRTAITAAALMIGIALVTGVSVLASSLTSSIENSVRTDLNAELIISGAMGGGPSLPPTFDPTVIERASGLPGVATAVGMRFDAAQLGDESVFVYSADVARLADVLRMTATAGSLRTLSSGEIVVDDEFAAERGLAVGGTLTLATQRGGERDYRVVGIYQRNELASGPVISDEDGATGFRTGQFNQGFVHLAPGADATAVRSELDALVADNPEVSVMDQTALVEQAKSSVDTFVVMLYVLLGLALVIAVLGIVNTLALSVLERTRELGLVRAIGMRRSQVVQMVTVESVVMAVFGAVLGIVVGGLLGAAIVRSLADEGITAVTVPWQSMGTFVLLAVLIGLLAAIVPAIRASRTNVLAAIAYE
ncbi:MAG TPA: ABC transporter permease [Pseudonocardiaceae bacterium]